MMPARPRVLLADDHPAMAKALGRVLEQECDVVGVVTDGSDVADAAMRLHPVVVVVDVNLPNVNGLDVCRDIMQHNPLAKVIVITGMMDDAIRDEALAAGASGFLHKLAAGSDLVGAIKQAWIDPAPAR
jgi:DNA-binding NarL/FixJ family response regulator